MKIKKRLRLNTWISLGAIVLMMVTLAWSFREVYRADRNVFLIEEMLKAAYERVFLRDDYLLNPSEQAKIQWYAQSEILRVLLESASERFTGTEDRAFLQEARKNFDTTVSSFSAILEKQKQKKPSDRKKLVVGEAKSRLISQVYLNAYALNDRIVRLHESTRRAAITARNEGIVCIVIFAVGSIIAIVINSIAISRTVTKRVTALHEGAEIIAGGNLDYHIDAVGDDELSDLARASNEMVTALKGSREYAESMINTVREPLIALDQDLRVVKVSRSFYEFFKVNPEETVGQLIYDLGNRQWDIPKLRELLETILPDKTTFDNYEVEHEFADIGRRIMLLNARQIQRALGKERVILLAIEDITGRKQIEAGLEKTRQELAVIKIAADEVSEYAESIINTVREPLIALDQDLRVVKVNRSFNECFKVKPEDTVGQFIYDLGNNQWDIPKLRELLETILPQQKTFNNYEVEHEFADIGRRIMLLNARQIQRALGKEPIILLAIEDITERREIESGLEKAHEEVKELVAELKGSARVKSEFLANMSHELRTPLNSINGFSEVLYDETFGPLNEKQKKYVNNVLTSGKHLLLLINQILDMAKVEAGRMNLTLCSLPIKSLLSEMSLLVADMVSKRNLQMLLEISEDLPNIEADDLKVKEIIYNLLSNAVKFTPEGGKIGMRAKKADSEIEIVVWDTGVGIARENMEKIFEGFFRVDTPYSRVTEGTGLGLPLSKKLVELHGGKLSVESKGLNEGISVRFTLPILSGRVV